MRYIGSKAEALPYLVTLVRKRAPKAVSFCDPFAGICTVARQFKRLGFRVVTGDHLYLSLMFQTAAVLLNRRPSFTALRAAKIVPATNNIPFAINVAQYLSKVRGVNGFITEHYSEAGRDRRKFFTVSNAMKIDAIRSKISAWTSAKLLSELEERFLLAALIDSADRVANTAGTYYAYLKHITRKAAYPLQFALPEIINNGQSNSVHFEDACNLVRSTAVDVLYLDPPYNERNYAGYYHFPETLARREEPEVVGRAGVPRATRQPRSVFCSPRYAADALDLLVERARARHILLHYTPSGLIPHRRILSILSTRGSLDFHDIHVRRYTAKPGIQATDSIVHRIYWCSCDK
jgi:adenine-specific DNA-methyltransferase